MKKLVFFLLLGATGLLNAQADTVQLLQLEQEMMVLAKTIMTDSIQENRLLANQQLKPKLEQALQLAHSFDYPFDSIPSISFQYPEDRSFRIITWQLYVDVEDYRYSGFIQTNAAQPVLFSLNDQSLTVEDPEYDILDADNWFGAVYYNIKSFGSKKNKKHVLFGYNGYKLFHKRKLAEVLSFENGIPVFGASVFQPKEENRPDLVKNRLVMTYSAESSIRLNYDESLELIVFDNLLTSPGSLRGQGPVMLPDGSYRGYKLKKGNWQFVEKLFTHTYETAPRPSPILEGRKGKNVFGKKKF